MTSASPVIGRRGLLTGLVGLMAAPAIVRVASLMPVREMAMSHAVENDIYAHFLAATPFEDFDTQSLKSLAIERYSYGFSQWAVAFNVTPI